MNNKGSNIFELLERAYGDAEAWTEVDEVLATEGYSAKVSRADFLDPFKNLVIGILSQNTNDRNCTRAYIGLAEISEVTPRDLANLPEAEIREAIRPGGLYNLKAKRIKELANAILRKYGGDASALIVQHDERKTRDRLLQLRGIGPKTADVFLAYCMDYDTVPVDTNIDRVAKRLGFVQPNARYEEIRNTLERIIPSDQRVRGHELLIRLGRDYCRARSPLCEKCPVAELCERHI
ncbi:endonuclease III [Candidatus Bipolaricaulota bacterium]|nr:endonuclease III [Candidatus Bipolaricaulota bacterium]